MILHKPIPCIHLIRAHHHLGKKDHETPRPLTVDEIKAVIQDYRKAAKNAKKAGFPGVEVHAANGYLINQFLDSKTNLRKDQYGGSLEKQVQDFKRSPGSGLNGFPR